MRSHSHATLSCSSSHVKEKPTNPIRLCVLQVFFTTSPALVKYIKHKIAHFLDGRFGDNIESVQGRFKILDRGIISSGCTRTFDEERTMKHGTAQRPVHSLRSRILNWDWGVVLGICTSISLGIPSISDEILSRRYIGSHSCVGISSFKSISGVHLGNKGQ